MSTPQTQQPGVATGGGAPPVPPAVPPTMRFDSNGDPIGAAQVSRNVPPKRVMVLPGNTVTYAGKSYGEGESLLIGEGPVADNLVMQGHVEIVDHYQVEEWNGKEGDAIRKAALSVVDAAHESDGTKREHDHGFVKYEHADGGDAEETEHTRSRQQAASEQQVRGSTMEDHQEQRRQQRRGKEES